MNSHPSSVPSTQLERLRVIRETVAIEAAALQTLAGQIGPEAVEAAERIAACRGSVVVTGVGKAGLIGQKLVATLASTGNRAHFLHPSEAIHGDLGRVGRDDVVLALSNSGRSEEVLRIAPHLHRHAASLLAITATVDNPLAELADLVITLGPHAEADPLGLAPTTSTTLMMAVGDAIAILASRLIGFSAADFARFHPGGNLGQKLAPVNRLMRPVAECRVAAAGGTVRETIIASGRGGRRTGAVMLVDDTGRLVGLFTDSDFARLMENPQVDSLELPIAEVMTKQFQSVDSGVLLIDAIEVLKDRRISELPVLDRSGRPLGLLDITDAIAMAPATRPAGDRRGRDAAVTIVEFDQDGKLRRRA